MRFGFDIDDTLINVREQAFHIYNQKLNTKVPIEEFYQIQRLEIHEPFGMDDIEGSKMWQNMEDEIYFSDIQPFPGALEFLQTLVNKGHDIFYITARSKRHGDRTKQWLKEKGFPLKEDHFFWGMKDEEKINFIQELQLDYYFDDSPYVLKTLLNESVRVFIKDQPYNRSILLPRFESWQDFCFGKDGKLYLSQK